MPYVISGHKESGRAMRKDIGQHVITYVSGFQSSCQMCQSTMHNLKNKNTERNGGLAGGSTAKALDIKNNNDIRSQGILILFSVHNAKEKPPKL